MMDIVELSRKMEADLLESYTSGSSYDTNSTLTRFQKNNGNRPDTDVETITESKRNIKKVDNLLRDPDIFSPRLTRFQMNNDKQTATVEEITTNILPKRKQKKVDEVEKIYLNKKAKVVHKNLETIYEDPIWKKGNTVLLGTSKVKRSIYLDREFRITSKQKSKLRKIKIKRLGKKKTKPFKMSDDEFKSRMLRIESYLNENDGASEGTNKDYNIDFVASDNIDYHNKREIESMEPNLKEEGSNSDTLYDEFELCE